MTTNNKQPLVLFPIVWTIFETILYQDFKLPGHPTAGFLTQTKFRFIHHFKTFPKATLIFPKIYEVSVKFTGAALHSSIFVSFDLSLDFLCCNDVSDCWSDFGCKIDHLFRLLFMDLFTFSACNIWICWILSYGCICNYWFDHDIGHHNRFNITTSLLLYLSKIFWFWVFVPFFALFSLFCS